jgi:hypothetical protein
MDVTLFTPHTGQETIINGFADSPHKFGVVACGRQFGKSLLAQNLILYWLLSNPGQKGCWISPVYNQCRKIFLELTNASHEIIIKSNKAELSIEFVNGSTIIFLSSERPDSIRGFSFNYVVIDEASFVSEQAANEAIFPTLSALGKKCLMISTPKGKNWFYNYFIRGLNDNHEVISFKGRSVDNPYISQTFINEQSKTLPDSIFKQEYLAEFTDAGSDVFTNVETVCILNGWTEPRNGERYFAGIDFGVTNDYSVLTIVSESGRVCFVERINGTSYAEIAKRFITALKKYRITSGYAEVNGPGLPVFELISSEVRALREFNTNNSNKAQGIRTLIYDIQEGVLELPYKDFFPHLYNELNAYSYKINATGTISFNAPSGYFDDCVMSLMLANESRTKSVVKKSGIYIGGGKQTQASVSWGQGNGVRGF